LLFKGDLLRGREIKAARWGKTRAEKKRKEPEREK